MSKTTRSKTIDPRRTREQLGINQTAFWSRLGVTQSGGSRYENGRQMPRPVATLARLAFAKPDEALAELARLRQTTVEELTGTGHAAPVKH